MKNWSVINEASFDIPKGLNQKSRILFCLPSDHFKSLIMFNAAVGTSNHLSNCKHQLALTTYNAYPTLFIQPLFRYFHPAQKQGLSVQELKSLPSEYPKSKT